jgi:hypothetical protein
MKKKLSIKDVFALAWKYFSGNISEWIILFGMQVILVLGFVVACLVCLSIFQIVLPQHSKLLTVTMISIGSIISFFFFIAFPIMYKQNALDEVFGRKLLGLDVTNRFFSYVMVTILYGTLVWMGMMAFVIPGMFLAQRWRFAGLHILEHGGSVRHACAASWRMTHGYVLFLAVISVLQWLVFMFSACFIVGTVFGIMFNNFVDVVVYKHLHTDFEQDEAVCACES